MNCYIFHYTDPNPAYELFVNRPATEVGLVYQLYEDEDLFEDYFRNGSTPFALDKRNRNVFYTSSDHNCIRKGKIDDQDMNEVCSCITNLCMYIIYTYAYKHCAIVCMNGMYCMYSCKINFSYFSNCVGLFLLLCPMTG